MVEVAALPGSLGLSVMGRPSAGKGRRTSSPSGSAAPKIFCFLPCPRSLCDPSEPLHGEAKNAPRRFDARGSNADEPTDAMDAGDVTAIFCPECGDEVEDLAPENFLVPGVGGRGSGEHSRVCDGARRGGADEKERAAG